MLQGTHLSSRFGKLMSECARLRSAITARWSTPTTAADVSVSRVRQGLNLQAAGQSLDSLLQVVFNGELPNPADELLCEQRFDARVNALAEDAGVPALETAEAILETAELHLANAKTHFGNAAIAVWGSQEPV